MEETKEKRYRQVQVYLNTESVKKILDRMGFSADMHRVKDDKGLVNCYLPEHLAWRVEKRIGGNSIQALSVLYLHQFSAGKSLVPENIKGKANIINQLLRKFLKAFATGKAGLSIDWEPTAEDLKK